jgi:hypothetical protein
MANIEGIRVTQGCVPCSSAATTVGVVQTTYRDLYGRYRLGGDRGGGKTSDGGAEDWGTTRRM